MSTSTRRAPSSPKRSALARPMPVLAPVITAALPARRIVVEAWELVSGGARRHHAKFGMMPPRTPAHQLRWLHLETHKTPIDRIVASRDERRRVRAEEERQ